ncbi:hypothetical protein ACFQE8_20625 [Salinirubellus sp. GCM10025818]|jgi:hypothetical protein|uniref:DUF7504 family protein n=1 Tax=Salinirubellus TaxID=2162630 RepID=UPI0030D51F46
MVPETSAGGAASFAKALASLKRRGSNLLLVGPAYEAAHLSASRRFMGDADSPRERLLVLTDRDAERETRLPDDADPVRTVEHRSLTRSTAATRPATSPGPLSVSGPDGEPHDPLVALGNEVADEIEAADERAGGLAPGQLRVCLDSLVPLLEEHDRQRVIAFLHAMTSDVDRVNGMAHYHLPVSADAEVVGFIEPLFDAVVELRVGTDGPQQRWTLTDGRGSTDWLALG